MKTILLIPFWFVLNIVFCWLYIHTHLSQTFYQATDTPDKHFRVLIINSNGENQAVSWQTAQSLSPSQWQCHETCIDSNCLCITNGNFIYHNSGAGWQTTSEYRIDGKQLIPISYRWFSISEMMFCMMAAAMVIMLAQYGWRCWQYRHCKEQLIRYHHAIGRMILWILAFILLFWIIIVNYFRI